MWSEEIIKRNSHVRTEYVIYGKQDDVHTFFIFVLNLIKGNELPFTSEKDKKNYKRFIMCLERGSVNYAAVVDQSGLVTMTLDTENYPEHEVLDNIISVAVGHKLGYFYDSKNVRDGDYRTNDVNHIFFNGGYVWDYMDELYSGLNECEAISLANSEFNEAFTSVDEANRFARENIGRNVIFRYRTEDDAAGLNENIKGVNCRNPRKTGRRSIDI